MEPDKPEKPEHPEMRMPPLQPRGRTAARYQAPVSGLTAVSDAVRTFLTRELEAHAVRITKIVPSLGADPGWKAEVEILVPDLAIKTLGLELTQEVLERRSYAVQLDHSLVVISYGPLDDDE